jgi:hypothetical protein
MKATNSIFKHVHCLIIFMVFESILFPAYGSIILSPLEDRISISPIIVSGNIVHITNDVKEELKSGDISYTDYYRTAYIQIDEVLKNDLADLNVASGDRLAIRIGPTEKRAKKVMKEREKDPRFITIDNSIWTLNKGDGGVWILGYYDNNLSVERFNLLDIAQLQQVKDIISRLAFRYQEALENEIPLYEAKRREMLSLPVTPKSEIQSRMEKPAPTQEQKNNALKKVTFTDRERDAKFFGFSDEQDRVVIAPNFTSAYDFSDGLAAVETSVWVKRSFYIDQAIKLSDKAPQYILVKRWGYINTQGQMVIPPLFDGAQPFQNGFARVRIYLPPDYPSRNQVFDALIDTTGRVVIVTSNPTVK